MYKVYNWGHIPYVQVKKMSYKLEKTFNGKKYKFYTRHRSKVYIESDKGILENYAKNIGSKVSFRTIKMKIDDKNWYVLYKRYYK